MLTDCYLPCKPWCFSWAYRWRPTSCSRIGVVSINGGAFTPVSLPATSPAASLAPQRPTTPPATNNWHDNEALQTHEARENTQELPLLSQCGGECCLKTGMFVMSIQPGSATELLAYINAVVLGHTETTWKLGELSQTSVNACRQCDAVGSYQATADSLLLLSLHFPLPVPRHPRFWR